MKISKRDGFLDVEIKAGELLEMYLGYMHDVAEYFCPLVHVLAKRRFHKKNIWETVDRLDNTFDDGIYACDKIVSANTCIKLLKAAKAPEKGLTKYRARLTQRGFTLKSGVVVGNAEDVHCTLTIDAPVFVSKIAYRGLEIANQREFYVCQPEDRIEDCSDFDKLYRIGLLDAVKSNDPDFVCKFSYPIRKDYQ